jgi:hypothetical protein
MIGAIRIALIVAFALGIVVATGDALTPISGASYVDAAVAQTGLPDRVRVENLEHVTVTGDVRPGDTLRLGEPKLLLRTYTLVYPASATFTNLRTGATVTLTDPAERPASFRLRLFIRQILMLTALVLLVIRGRQPAVLALATYIYLVEYTLPAFSGYWLGTWGATAYVALQGPLGVIQAGTLVYLASTFASKTRGVKTLLFAAYIGTALFALFEVASVVAAGLYGEQWDPGASLLDVVQIALTCAALVVFVISARAAESGERRRILILMAAAAIGSAYTIIGLFGNAVFTTLQSDLALASVVVMEIGLVYAIVFERLFDIGFFVNRAVVYAVTSAIVLLAFVAIEWLAAHEAETLGHFESSAIQLGLAVVVALSLRPIHHRVDEFVDGVIFEARHRAANALHRFAEDCGEYQEADALLRTTLATLKMYGRVSECAIFLADETGESLRGMRGWYLDGKNLRRRSDGCAPANVACAVRSDFVRPPDDRRYRVPDDAASLVDRRDLLHAPEPLGTVLSRGARRARGGRARSRCVARCARSRCRAAPRRRERRAACAAGPRA